MSLTSSTNIKINWKKVIFNREKKQASNFLAFSVFEEI